jgi:hypothetical protein
MTIFTHGLMCIVGVLFMVGAFYATGMRGAFSRSGPLREISKAGRVLIFLTGAVPFIDGCDRLLGRLGNTRAGWRVAIPLTAVLIFALFLNSRSVRAFMGRAERSSPTLAIRFANGLPSAMVVVRVAFFVIVGVMVVLGVGPVADTTARVGIIACVLALLVTGLLYGVLESYYIKTERATMTEVPVQSGDRENER